ncbi:MAG: zinc ribbon domain-containing protein [Chloroflexi bacterium]|nr:zinc ribbon domain-containing protein [Chloroflexota bacterium]
MPIYEYRCNACGHRFSRLSRVVISADEETPPLCPSCSSAETVRLVSSFSKGGPPGPDAQEVAYERQQAERLASITPREKIEEWRKARKD